MPHLPGSVLPNRIPHGPHKPSAAIQVSPLLGEAAGCEPETILRKLRTIKEDLSAAEAALRLREFGPNVVAGDERHPRMRLLANALVNPLVLLLVALHACLDNRHGTRGAAHHVRGYTADQ
jgi:P-type Mg2+ transporter